MDTPEPGFTCYADTWCAVCVPSDGLLEAKLFEAGEVDSTDLAALPIPPDSEWDSVPTCNNCGVTLQARVTEPPQSDDWGRVQIPAHFDEWMQGDRYGTVVNVNGAILTVLLDKSARRVKVAACDARRIN